MEQEPLHSGAPGASMSVAIERALLRALSQEWSQLNRDRFRGALRAPVFGLSGPVGRRGTNLGTWAAVGRTLQIDRDFALKAEWTAVREVLLHEMAHQFVDETYSLRDETPHGPTFQAVCARFGIDGRASSVPGTGAANPDSGGATPKIVERVRKLLALATSANQHEAEAAMNAAQALLLRYNLDALGTSGTRIECRTLGEPGLRHSEEEKLLASIVTKHFFVKAIWIRVYLQDRSAWGTVLEVCGTHENVEMSAYVHHFLQETTVRLWEQHGAGHTRTSLARFRAGAYLGFFQKLAEQATKHASTGLVWVGDAAVDEVFEQRHPRVRTVRSAGFRRDSDFHSGKTAGRQIVLHRPIAAGSSSGAPLQIEKKGG